MGASDSRLLDRGAQARLLVWCRGGICGVRFKATPQGPLLALGRRYRSMMRSGVA